MKRMLAVILMVIASGSLLWAKGGGQASSGGGQSRVYSIMFPLIFPEVPSADAPVVLALKKLTPIPFEFQYVPTDGYQDRLNISIAAGELPDTFVVTEPKHNTFVSAVNGGLMWEVNDLIKSSKNLSKDMPQQILTNTNIGGKNYFIPRSRTMVRVGYVFRKDWLTNLGLNPPADINEVYNVIKAFATQDPDKNGKQDTVGLITAVDSTGIWQFWLPALAHGAGNGWVVENGSLVPTFMTKPYIDTIRFYKRLYDEKLMNQDFATIRAERALEILNTEAGGFFFDSTDRPSSRFEVLVKTKQVQNPNIELEDLWDFSMEVKGLDGSIRFPANAGHGGGYAFPKTSLKTQAELQACFDIIDAFDSPEAKNLLRWGIEGRHYQLQPDGKAVLLNPDNLPRELGLFGQLTTGTAEASIQGIRRPYSERTAIAQALASERYGVSDPTFPLISATQTSRGAELQKIIADAQIQWVMGQIDEAGYMAAIERWKSSGGQAVMDEFTQAWRASQ